MTNEDYYVNYYHALIKEKKESDLNTRPSNLVYLVMKLAEAEFYAPYDDEDAEKEKQELLLNILEGCFAETELIHILMTDSPDLKKALYYRGCFSHDKTLLVYCAEMGLFNRQTIETIIAYFNKEYELGHKGNHTGHDTDFELDMVYGVQGLGEMLKKQKDYETQRGICG